MTQPLTERLRAFAARWRKSMGRRGGYGDEIYEIDTGAPSHVVLTVQMVEQSADRIDALEATQAELVEALEHADEVLSAVAEDDGLSPPEWNALARIKATLTKVRGQ